ncbi:hypothetical protein LL06_22885 [Hoeflea sp. BAL378]|nr:hypothetical protein LL06_22885 [Hoeflea sp. BAL378]
MFGAACLAAGLALAPGLAQAQDSDQAQESEAQPADCVPQAPMDGDGAQPQPGASPDTNLTEQLKECDGVLRPPPVGDSEFTEPAPPVGETPVIEPEDLPPQNSN